MKIKDIIKAVLLQGTIISINNLALLLIIFTKGYLKIIGYVFYILTGILVYYLIYNYIEINLKGVENGS